MYNQPEAFSPTRQPAARQVPHAHGSSASVGLEVELDGDSTGRQLCAARNGRDGRKMEQNPHLEANMDGLLPEAESSCLS